LRIADRRKTSTLRLLVQVVGFLVNQAFDAIHCRMHGQKLGQWSIRTSNRLRLQKNIKSGNHGCCTRIPAVSSRGPQDGGCSHNRELEVATERAHKGTPPKHLHKLPGLSRDTHLKACRQLGLLPGGNDFYAWSLQLYLPIRPPQEQSIREHYKHWVHSKQRDGVSQIPRASHYVRWKLVV